eukprot:1190263-Prorocentrum_minimum.AAC.1
MAIYGVRQIKTVASEQGVERVLGPDLAFHRVATVWVKLQVHLRVTIFNIFYVCTTNQGERLQMQLSQAASAAIYHPRPVQNEQAIIMPCPYYLSRYPDTVLSHVEVAAVRHETASQTCASVRTGEYPPKYAPFFNSTSCPIRTAMTVEQLPVCAGSVPEKCVQQDRCVEEARDALNTFDLFDAEDEEPQWEPMSVTKNGREVSLYFDPARVWIWDASRILSEWCLDNTALLSSKRILELGSGLGVPSLVASLYAKEVIVTDNSQGAIDGLADNIEQNRRHQPENPNIFSTSPTLPINWCT